MLRITEINGNDVSVPGMEEGEEEWITMQL